MKRTLKIAGTLAAALMMSAPLALAATPSFASTMHNNDRHDGDRSNYRGDNDRNDRDGRGMKHEKIVFRVHNARHFGHWGYAHGHRVWIAAFNVR